MTQPSRSLPLNRSRSSPAGVPTLRASPAPAPPRTAAAIAERAAALADAAGARVVVLPAVPFGNNAQQLDQVATISLRTATALAVLADVARSLAAQGIDRLVPLNAHGGNDFKPLVRD